MTEMSPFHNDEQDPLADYSADPVKANIYKAVSAVSKAAASDDSGRLQEALGLLNQAVAAAANNGRAVMTVEWFGGDDWDDAVVLPAPTMWTRTDGRFLIYPGQSHTCAGEPGGGKTWGGLNAAHQVLLAGGFVLMADFESDPLIIRSRLKMLGVTKAQAARFAYLRLDTSRLTLAMVELLDLAAKTRPQLVIIDGQAQALSMAGKDENSNQDVSMWSSIVVRPLLDLGCATFTIDHLAKAQDGEVKYARGAGAKLADVTGVAYALLTKRSFSQEKSGYAELVVLKDRNGAVGAKGDVAAIIKFTPKACQHDAMAGLAPELEVEVCEPMTGPFVPGEVMEKVSKTLAQGGLSKTELKAAIGGKGQTVVTAIQLLTRFGFIETEKVGRAEVLTNSRLFVAGRDADGIRAALAAEGAEEV